MKTIALIAMVSVVLEALIEYVKTFDRMLVSRDYKTAITQGLTIVLGIFLAFVFNLHLFNGAMSEIYQGLTIDPTIDIVLTGILFSRCSNFFSDLVSKLKKTNSIEIVGTEYVGEDYVIDDDEEDYTFINDELEEELGTEDEEE